MDLRLFAAGVKEIMTSSESRFVLFPLPTTNKEDGFEVKILSETKVYVSLWDENGVSISNKWAGTRNGALAEFTEWVQARLHKMWEEDKLEHLYQ